MSNFFAHTLVKYYGNIVHYILMLIRCVPSSISYSLTFDYRVTDKTNRTFILLKFIFRRESRRELITVLDEVTRVFECTVVTRVHSSSTRNRSST